jgi:hypothetical protein
MPAITHGLRIATAWLAILSAANAQVRQTAYYSKTSAPDAHYWRLATIEPLRCYRRFQVRVLRCQQRKNPKPGGGLRLLVSPEHGGAERAGDENQHGNRF